MVVNKQIKRLIRVYFQFGLSYDEILCFLALKDRTVISKRTLCRILKEMNLKRRANYSDLLETALFINGELQSSGKHHGYRWMHLKCLQSGISVPRDVVCLLLQILDPEGVEGRKRRRLRRRQYSSRGPNYVWHIDSYDKLKPYGIAVNGCIDGFSRNVIWLDACTTNSDPKVIAGYYIDAVQRKGGCPQRIRADMGSENSYVEQMQIFLRRNHEDYLSGINSFIYGKSTHNQRIEWFWGILRKQLAQYWMDVFKSFQAEEDTQFCGDLLDKSLIQHCFIELIQNDLDNLQATWNTHSNSSKSNGIRQGNKPVMMYSLPELFDKEDCLCTVDMEEVYMCSEETVPKNERMCDETVKKLCSILMDEQGLDYPDNVDDAIHLYICLRREIRLLL